MTTLEQENAHRLLQRLDPGAHARLRDTERIGCMAEVQALRDGQGLNER